MLAGYLPFDDDPANPEGDNINLLYKYITSTPLTFPEYVTPHARDLLRRILVADPRKRADLFEVARHSWLSEYHHVVSHITSSTTNIADISNSTIPAGTLTSLIFNSFSKMSLEQQDAPLLNRSASVREPTKPVSTVSPIGALSHQQAKLAQNEDPDLSKVQRDKATRHTLQPEYVAPQSHTARGEGSPATFSASGSSRGQVGSQGQMTAAAVAAHTTLRSKPLPQQPPVDNARATDYPPVSAAQQKMPPPTRPARDVPRSASDSTGAFGVPPQQQPTAYSQATRPSTGGSLTSLSGPSGTRSDIRLPSRGSYGQPVAPTVAATNAQGRVTQPKNGRSYNISGPIAQHMPQGSIGQLMTQQLPAQYNETPAAPPAKAHHRRSSTLSGLGERLFGRSGSVMRKQDTDSPRQKNGRKYPPTSMKDPYPSENPRRTSVESKRSFTFGLGKKKSVDLESQEEKPPRRFSLLPASMSMSFKGLMGGNKDQDSEAESPVPQAGDFPQPPEGRAQTRPTTGQNRVASYDTQDSVPLGHDGQYEQPRPVQVNNFSRPPQHYRQPSSQPPNDVYGGTGVYVPTSQYQDRSYLTGPTPPVEQQYRDLNQPYQYPEGFNSYDPPRASMQPGRQGKGPGVLQKNNRKFTDAYENEHGPTHHEGSSGAAKKVMDFFRRRGRARVDDYR